MNAVVSYTIYQHPTVKAWKTKIVCKDAKKLKHLYCWQ